MRAVNGRTLSGFAVGAAVAAGLVALPGSAFAATPAPAGAAAVVPAAALAPAEGCRPWLNARGRNAEEHGRDGQAAVLYNRAERRAAWAGCVA